MEVQLALSHDAVHRLAMPGKEAEGEECRHTHTHNQTLTHTLPLPTEHSKQSSQSLYRKFSALATSC